MFYLDRVSRGVTFLDNICPNWRSEIDVDRLDMSNYENCILGQLYGDFEDGCKKLHLSDIQSCNLGLWSYRDMLLYRLPVGNCAFATNLTRYWKDVLLGYNSWKCTIEESIAV